MDVCVSLQLQEGNCGEEVEPRLCVLAPVLFLQRSGEGDCRKARCSTIPEKMLQGGGKKKKKSRRSGGWQTWEKNKAEYHKNRVKNEGGERFLLLCMCMRRSWGKDRADAQKSNACFVCLWSRSSKQFFVELWQVRRIMMLAYFRLTWLLLVPSPS